tara:strand:+ start:3736 stop:4110 length:375 start_codon:yes stop_codon:yes gene_type:complete
MIKAAHAILVIFFCLWITVSLRIFGLKKNIEISYDGSFLLNNFSIKRTIRILNYLYTNKIFSCLVCALLIKRIKIHENKRQVLNIGINEDQLNHLKSHAWITFEGKIIFGLKDDLNSYKNILKK